MVCVLACPSGWHVEPGVDVHRGGRSGLSDTEVVRTSAAGRGRV